jgi:uncharacterized protein (UPF0147 family)
MASVTVDVMNVERVKNLAQVMKEFTYDERVPAVVREEFMDKVNLILESKDDD